jgi:trehalose 6-phosphate phosphatase
MMRTPPEITHWIDIQDLQGTAPLWLFLDYDGTLADFAPTPDHILPDPALIALLERLSQRPGLRVSVVSGRRLAHIQKLLPIPGLLLAGSYGLELCTPQGECQYPLDYDDVRPTLEAIKPHWQALLEGRQGFYLEDKGWSLALHARFAADEEADQVLESALPIIEAHASREGFRILGGHKFLEIGPPLAHKGQTVESLLQRFALPGANLLFIGDDDKDEEAFETIHAHGGLAIVVSAQPRPSRADYRLPNPQAVRRWLQELDEAFSNPPAGPG